jgi:hypothetical protein
LSATPRTRDVPSRYVQSIPATTCSPTQRSTTSGDSHEHCTPRLCVPFPRHVAPAAGHHLPAGPAGAFTGITGPLTSALTQIAALGPGIKALVGFVGFVVALISLSALRNFGPVLFYVGLAIFAAVGLVIAGAIMGAVI